MSNQIEQIRAEIERRKKVNLEEGETGWTCVDEDDEILHFIDQLPAQPVPSDIQEAADKYIGHPQEVDEGIETKMRRDSYIDGMLAERERLMKEAVEIDTDITINRYTKQHILHISSTDEHIQHLPQGEYKAIIIKKEK